MGPLPQLNVTNLARSIQQAGSTQQKAKYQLLAALRQRYRLASRRRKPKSWMSSLPSLDAIRLLTAAQPVTPKDPVVIQEATGIRLPCQKEHEHGRYCHL